MLTNLHYQLQIASMRTLKKTGLALGLLLFSAVVVFAQNRTIKGKVLSAKDNTPVAGASVVIKGAPGGTTKIGRAHV